MGSELYHLSGYNRDSWALNPSAPSDSVLGSKRISKRISVPGLTVGSTLAFKNLRFLPEIVKVCVEYLHALVLAVIGWHTLLKVAHLHQGTSILVLVQYSYPTGKVVH